MPACRVRSARSRREKPADLDWLRFLGPVAYRDWNPGMYFSFRSFLEFNGGKMTDFGHHWMDVVHMYMGERAPHAVTFAGGNYYDRQDGRTAPDTCNALFEYDGFSALFQSNAYAVAPRVRDHVLRGQGQAVRGSQSLGVHAGGPQRGDRRSARSPATSPPTTCAISWIAARAANAPNADAAIAAVSILPPLLAVQSYEEQRRIRFDPVRLEVLPF